MKQKVFLGLILIAIFFLLGCVSDKCPSSYTVEKTDRIRCFATDEEMTSLQTANILTGGLTGICNDMNCAPITNRHEVSCPNACINSWRNANE